MNSAGVRLSKFVTVFRKEDHTCLFHGLSMRKVYGRSELLDSVLNAVEHGGEDAGNSEAMRNLEDAGFLVREGDDERMFRELRARVGSINVSNMVMLVCNDCNFACRYCQIEENMTNEQKRHRMSLETARKAMDLFESHAVPSVARTISITGGEPMMNVPTVRYIVERAATIEKSRVIIFTNGALIDEDLARYFAEHKTLMLVSLDGPAPIHDAVRVKADGSGTFAASVRGYRMLKNAGCAVGISAVTGIHNEKKMDEVTAFFKELDPPSIGLNFGHYLLDKENDTAVDMGTFADMLTRFYATMRADGIFVENISRFIMPFCLENPRLNECQAQGRGFCVDSRGKLGVCKSLLVSDEISMSMDDVNRIDEIGVFREWAMRSPLTLDQCRSCPMVGVCGGGCTYDAYALHKRRIDRIDDRLCEYTRKVLEFLVWDLFEGIADKVGNTLCFPTKDEQKAWFLDRYDPDNELQRSVGHEKDR